jgi:riboflavin synthase
LVVWFADKFATIYSGEGLIGVLLFFSTIRYVEEVTILENEPDSNLKLKFLLVESVTEYVHILPDDAPVEPKFKTF